MARIQRLPKNLSNQIAAGEVVERPASVIKELIENSIDAGAHRINVETELGGRRLMQVADDGEGMAGDDAVLAFERYATSKIASQEDLGGIRTLGFRGEALASIASVAKVELLTYSEEADAGTRVNVEGGSLVSSKDAPRPKGTTVTVRDLFFNTPARRKFMRSQATENFHISNIVTHYALANPAIAFTLKSNGRDVIRISTASDLRERAFQLFGRDLIESLLPVSGGREFVATISGFVSAPRERRSNRDSQYFFINGRFVKDKIIAAGLREGFRSVLPHGIHPVAFLFIELPFDEVDVNVHPAKTEVRFRRSLAVRDVIAEAVRSSLGNAGIGAGSSPIDPPRATTRSFEDRKPESTKEEQTAAASVGDALGFDQGRIGFEIEADAGDFEKSASSRSIIVEPADPARIPYETTDDERSNVADSGTRPSGTSDLPPFDSALSAARAVETADIDPSGIRPLGQLHDSFIVAADREGLLLIDQHVAHERILFDRFRRDEEARRTGSQALLHPETLELSPAQASVFDEIAGELEAAGFGLMRLSGRTVAVNGIPSDIRPEDASNLLRELLETYDSVNKGGGASGIRDGIAASLACKAAIKINTPLAPEKMEWLVDRLLKTSSPTTCPHGRPVVLRLSMKDIERKFHRS